MKKTFASTVVLFALPLFAIACGAGPDEHPSSTDEALPKNPIDPPDNPPPVHTAQPPPPSCTTIDTVCKTSPSDWTYWAGLEPLLQAAGCATPFFYSDPPYIFGSHVSLCPDSAAVHAAVAQYSATTFYGYVASSTTTCNHCMAKPPSGKTWVAWMPNCPPDQPNCQFHPVCPSSCRVPGI